MKTFQMYSDVQTRKSSDTIATFCLVVGLIAAFVADIIKANVLAQGAELGAISIYSDDLVMPFQWRITSGLALLLLTAGGFVALLTGAAANFSPGFRLAFFVLQGWMALRYLIEFSGGFDLYEFIYFKGPASWLSCFAMFLVLDQRRWLVVKSLMYYFAWTATFLFLLAAVSAGFGDRFYILRAVGNYLFLLQYPAMWLLFVAMGTPGSALRAVPYLVFLAGAAYTGTRSLIIVSILSFLLALKISKTSGMAPGARKAFSAAGFSALLLGLMFLGAESDLANSLPVLYERLTEDTRSEQYIEFFDQVSPWSLILGLGSRATWVWQGRLYGSIDGTFVLMAFIGGLPLVLSYVIVVFSGPLKVFRARAKSFDSQVSAAMIFFWGLALLGLGIYSAPEAKTIHYLLLMFSGRCWAELRQGAST